MERLRKKDADDGVSELFFSEEQKAEIAEIKRIYSAKLAELEILHKSQLATTFEPEERMKAEEGHRREVQRVHDEQERKLAKIRGS